MKKRVLLLAIVAPFALVDHPWRAQAAQFLIFVACTFTIDLISVIIESVAAKQQADPVDVGMESSAAALRNPSLATKITDDRAAEQERASLPKNRTE